MCGDFWQLHPVSGAYLASDPTTVFVGRAQKVFLIFGKTTATPLDTIGNSRS